MVDTQSGKILETLTHQASHPSLLQLFLGAELVVQIIMVGLVLTSLLCWAIIFSKSWAFYQLSSALHHTEQEFWQHGPHMNHELLPSTSPSLFKKLLLAMAQETTRFKKNFSSNQSEALGLFENRLEKTFGTLIRQEIESASTYINVLATVGSSSLFVGLFGTVWGIIHSFQSIAATKNTSLAVVAPGIAEALLATALGLIVAIPAVIAYNKLSETLNSYALKLENLSDRLLLFSTQTLLNKD